jgi:hypothetical protein
VVQAVCRIQVNAGSVRAADGGQHDGLGFEASRRALLNTIEVEAHSRNATAHATKRSCPTASPAA